VSLRTDRAEEPDDAQGKETTMAVIHPDDRIAYVQPARAQTGGGRLHPAVGLVVGFGFIIGVATLVHVVFNTLV